ncbi:unnamed protein product, partial [Prorocentrum cordatum]
MSPIVKLFGLWRCLVAGHLCLALCFSALPLCPNPASLVLLHSFTNGMYGLVGASLVAALNNAAPCDRRATVNGVVVTFESIGKGLGPALTSVAFAEALSRWGWAGHYIVFYSIGGAHAFLSLGAFFMPGNIEGAAGAAEKLRRSPVVGSGSPGQREADAQGALGAAAASAASDGRGPRREPGPAAQATAGGAGKDQPDEAPHPQGLAAERAAPRAATVEREPLAAAPGGGGAAASAPSEEA